MVSLRTPSSLPVVGVLVDGQTYRQLLYVLLAVPLGFLYYALFSVGLLFGLLLSIVLVGIVVLFATLLGARLVAGFERWLANRLLGTGLDPYDDLPTDPGGRLGGVRKYVDAPSTWRGVGFLSLKSVVTFLAFVPIFGLANAISLLAAPFRYPYTASFGEVNGEPVTWAITTLPEALVGLSLGVVGVVVVLHVSNLIAYVARRMAVALLGDPAVSDSGAVTSDSGAVTSDSGAVTSDSGAVTSDSGSSVAAVDDSDGVAWESESDAENDSGSTASESESDGDRSVADRFEYVAFDDEDGAETLERDSENSADRDSDR